MSAPSADRIAVGRIGRAHGVRGDVQVQPLTDAPDQRFVAGVVLHVSGGGAGATLPTRLTVSTVQWHQERLLVGFHELTDRNGAEALRGCFLEIEAAQAGEAGDDAWWDHQLVGLRAELADGAVIGVVTEVVHLPSQDLLVIRREGGGDDLLVPFVSALVPLVEPSVGRLVVAPPEGLLEL